MLLKRRSSKFLTMSARTADWKLMELVRYVIYHVSPWRLLARSHGFRTLLVGIVLGGGIVSFLATVPTKDTRGKH
jgi:hypothetical protein